jgi:hypothetical protein
MRNILLATLTAAALSSCATTGDPSSGGLFGWSEQQYQQDMANKRSYLNATNADTARMNSQAAGVRSQINRY